MSIAYSDTTHDLIFEWLGAHSEHIDFNTGETTRSTTSTSSNFCSTAITGSAMASTK